MDDLAGSITDGRFHEQKVNHIDTKTWQNPLGEGSQVMQFYVSVGAHKSWH